MYKRTANPQKTKSLRVVPVAHAWVLAVLCMRTRGAGLQQFATDVLKRMPQRAWSVDLVRMARAPGNSKPEHFTNVSTNVVQ